MAAMCSSIQGRRSAVSSRPRVRRRRRVFNEEVRREQKQTRSPALRGRKLAWRASLQRRISCHANHCYSLCMSQTICGACLEGAAGAHVR